MSVSPVEFKNAECLIRTKHWIYWAAEYFVGQRMWWSLDIMGFPVIDSFVLAQSLNSLYGMTNLVELVHILYTIQFNLYYGKVDSNITIS